MPQPLPLSLVTRRELADALGCHMQTVTKYEREGMPIAKRGDRGKASLYDEAAVRTWLAQRADGAQAAVAAIDLADVRRAWAEEIAAVRAILLRGYAARADQVHRAAAIAGVAGVARELQAITCDVLRNLASNDRAVVTGLSTVRGARDAGQAALVIDALRQARALYAPPAHMVATPSGEAERAAPAPVMGRRVARSNYLGR